MTPSVEHSERAAEFGSNDDITIRLGPSISARMSKITLTTVTTTALLLVIAYTCCCVSQGAWAQYQPIQQVPVVTPNSLSTLDNTVAVYTQMGQVMGRTVVLWDGPNRGPEARAQAALYAQLGSQPSLSWRTPILSPLTVYPYRNVSVFLGIPYARPPLREHGLRFKLPQPADKWTVLMADKYRPACPQPVRYTGIERAIAQTDEDCLYLNIFTPYVRPKPLRPFPVILHIHGGRYEHGSGNAFPGHMLAASQEVVVVTFNYRLGVLGYLATADNSSAGNYGLADQLAALQWVRDNIEQFNGDPHRITLWGTEAGAASAGLLAISPRSRDLVKRVIAQSGAAIADWAVQRNPLVIRNTSIVVGEHFGCFSRDSMSLVRCLEARSFNEFTTTSVTPDIGWLAFAPVSDYRTRDRDLALLPDLPEHYFTMRYSEFPENFAYMSGVTRNEGSPTLLMDPELRAKNYIVTAEMFERRLRWPWIRTFNATRNEHAFIKALDFMYSPAFDRSNLTQYLQGLIDLEGDAWAVAGHTRMVQTMLKKGVPTYAYVLNYTIEGLMRPEPWMGVPHDTEYFLVSGAPFMEPKYFPSIYDLSQARWTESDRNMSQLFMEAFANFARDGIPTPVALFNNILWEPATVNQFKHLSINTTNLTSVMHRDYRTKYAQFWNEYIYTLLDYDPITNYWPNTFSPLEMELRNYRAATWAAGFIAAVLVLIVLLCTCMYCRVKR
ncbi:Neuroligin-3, partial [Fragariocoptes setiger]